MEQFVDRDRELGELTDCYESETADFVVTYGRRRLGKSELVRQSIADRDDAVYYQAVESTAPNQLEQFVDTATAVFPSLGNVRRDWEVLLKTLGEEDAVVVIDEFPFLIEEDESLPSRIQRVWDMELQETGITLLLVGSSISVMEDKVLSGSAPLYGRRTGTIDLTPLSVADAREFFPEYDPETAIIAWAIYGGTPYYLQTIDPDQQLGTNVQQTILSERGLLYSEPEFLLRTELRQPNTYFSILRALAHGRRTPNEIAGAVGIDPGPLSKYLQTLRRLRLIDREVPVTASAKQSKRSRYHVADEFLRFWFRFVEPNRSSIQEAPDVVYDGTIEPNLPDHVATTFEDVCQEAVWEAIRGDQLESYSEVGRWWYGEDEIDIVGLAPDADRILFAECKWTSEPVGPALVSQLREKAERVRWGPDTRDEDFALFSKSGFVDGVADDVDENWSLYGLSELRALL